MSSTVRAFVVLLLSILGLAGLSAWLQFWLLAPPPPVATEIPEGVEAQRLESVRSAGVDQDGTGYQVNATNMVRQHGTARITLSQPKITQYRADGVPWQAVAERGWLDEENDAIQLEGNVRIVEGAEGAVRYRLNATSMRRERATQRITLSQPQLTQYRADATPWHAVAAHGWLDQKTDAIRLEGDVQIVEGAREFARYRVSAASMLRTHPSQPVALTQPYIIQYRENDVPWHAFAERGWLDLHADTLLLEGDVRVLEGAYSDPRDAVSAAQVFTQAMRVSLARFTHSASKP